MANFCRNPEEMTIVILVEVWWRLSGGLVEV